MPPLPSPGKVVRIRITSSWGDDQNIQNHFYMNYANSVSGADCGTINGLVESAWSAHMAALLPPAYTMTSVETTDLSSSTGAQVASPYTVAGTASGSPISAGAAVVIHGVTARRFRGGHARVYIAGIMEGNIQSPQLLTTAALGTYFTAWTAIPAAVASSPPADAGAMAAVAVSFYSGFTTHTGTTGRIRNVPTLRSTPLVDLITSWVVNGTIASQRRRNRQSV